MSTALSPKAPSDEQAGSREAAILDALPLAVLLIGSDDAILHANPAAEELFGMSRAVLSKNGLSLVVAPYSNLLALVKQVRHRAQTMFEYNVALELPRGAATRLVDVRAAPLQHEPNRVVLALALRTVAEQLRRQ